MRIVFLFVFGACAPMSSSSGPLVNDVWIHGTSFQVQRCNIQLHREGVVNQIANDFGVRATAATAPDCTMHDDAFASAVLDGAK